MKAALPNLWIFAGRPDALIGALATLHALADRVAESYLVIELNKAWHRTDFAQWTGEFTDSYTIPQVPHLHSLKALWRQGNAARVARDRLVSLPIRPQDLLVTFSCLTHLGKVIASKLIPGRKVLVISQRKFNDYSRPLDFGNYRHTTSGLINTWLIEPALGLPKSYHLKAKNPVGQDGQRLRRFERSWQDLYSHVLVCDNADAAEIPSGIVRYCRHPIPPLAAAAGKKTRVIFFGTPYLSVRNIEPEVYVKRLNECLWFMRSHYPTSDFELCYRPHPAETTEQDGLELDHFTTETDLEAAELHFLRRGAEVAAVFSVGSTVLRTALTFGIRAYAFYPVFPFAAATQRFFENVLGSVPDPLLIQDLKAPPVPYSPPEPTSSATSFEATLLNSLFPAP